MKKQIVIYHIVFVMIIIFHSGCHINFFNIPDQTTLLELKNRYDVSVNSTWTGKRTEILLATLDSIYQNADDQNHNLTASVWVIGKEEMPEEVKIQTINDLKLVTVNPYIFALEESGETENSNKRLFNVVAKFITEDWTNLQSVKLILKDGTDRDAIELVLKKMYGLSIVRKDTPEAEKIAKILHKYVGEVIVSDFSNQDLMKLMSVYELFPRGLDKIPKMKYLLRRQQAPYAGSAWIVADCIEYDGRTFRIKNPSEFKRIILHEKAHFLWEYALNGKLRRNWSELGGWHKDPENNSRWLKSKNREEFITDYAYAKNPNEDWAESVAFYFIRPNKLRTSSLEKYEFIDRVMQQYQDGDVAFERLQHIDN